MPIFARIARHIATEEINGRVYKTGMLKRKKDKRDFRYGKLIGWGIFGASYTGKHDSLVLPVVSVKDQYPHNTCTQDSATGQKESDEGVQLSEQGLTALAKEAGVITENGFSTLQDIQKVIQKKGIPERRLLDKPLDDFNQYSSVAFLTPEVRANAELHRSASYFGCNNREERLKALDDGRTLHAGLDWYSEYNMNGGFSAPWLILGNGKVLKLGGAMETDNFSTTNIGALLQGIWRLLKRVFNKTLGWLVGGHAFRIIGYNKNYHGYQVYVCLNSYGPDWGNGGMFYIEMDHYDKFGHGAYAQVDIAVDVASFLQNNQFAFVRDVDHTKKAVYMIWGQEKHAFTNWVTCLAWEVKKENIIDVEPDMLMAIKDGDDMVAQEGPAWNLIKELAQPDNYKQVIELSKINS